MKIFALLLALCPVFAMAEYRRYGQVQLEGLSRNHWHLREPGMNYTMVCNVNGRDGYLSVRSGPGTNYPILRNLRRLAILEVDTMYRQGRWIYVRTAFRTHSEYGYRLQENQDLHVEGWAHDGYMCEFTPGS